MSVIHSINKSMQRIKTMTTTEKKHTNKEIAELEDVPINVKIKLAALWATLMFLYTYGDILGFYTPGN